jgi:hypothetical protein
MMLAGLAGCHMILPDVSHQPMVHNPFPQLSRVAVAPFFNQSDEPTVDGRKFALAYFAELQATPGFEVVPLGVVEEAILEHRVDLSNAGEARRLAQILNVDAVVIGSVTDYTPYYPPRCGLRVEWYAANPGFHAIPPGYGLPWGTPEEEFIPQPLVFEAEMALAKAQMATQTPDCPAPPTEHPRPTSTSEHPALFMPMPSSPAPENDRPRGKNGAADASKKTSESPKEAQRDSETSGVTGTSYEEQITEEELPPGASSGDASLPSLQPAPSDSAATIDAIGRPGDLPFDWPDESSFIPLPPSCARPPCVPHHGPVMTHTRIYHGSDGDFTEALASYYHFRNDARFGGWQNYLQRSDDFIRFCCHVHISEMLSARGGADPTRVVWRWSDSR